MNQVQVQFHQPDPRFLVTVARVGNSFIFASTRETRPIQEAPITEVPGSNVILVGDCRDALKSLILQYGNAGLAEKIPGGITPTPLRAIRKHLGIAAEAVQGRGGVRPGSGHGRKRPGRN